jgi:phage shock protein E
VSRLPLLTRLLPVLAVLLGALVACGGDDDAGGEEAGAAAAAPATPSALAPDEALEVIASGDRVLLDVRTPEEYAAGHVEGAENLDASADDFADRVAGLDPDAAYVVYCQTGNRSSAAAEVMREAGLDVEDAGGIEALEDAGADVVR